MSNPVRISTSNTRWGDVGRDAGVVGKGTRVEGKSAAETKRAQRSGSFRGGAAGLYESAVTQVATEIATQAGSKALAGFATLATPVITGYEFIKAYVGAHNEGKALRRAHERDAVHLAFVLAANQGLPPDYVARMRYEKRAVDGERGGAAKILTRLMKNDAIWQRLQSESASGIKRARQLATRRGITTPAALKAWLAADTVFAKNYRSDLAMKHGVDSVIFQNRMTAASGK